MPVLRYWDEAQQAYIDLMGAGPPGQVYAEVGATEPDPINPTINPPHGALWVDTSTDALYRPYVPPQAPPASGFNSFLDDSGEAWVSMNGSPWKRARDVLWCRYHHADFLSTAGAWADLRYDQVDRDPYSMYQPWGAAGPGMITPIEGTYHFVASMTLGGNPGAMGITAWVDVSRTVSQINTAAGAHLDILVTDDIYLIVGQRLHFSILSDVASWCPWPNLPQINYMTIRYVGGPDPLAVQEASQRPAPPQIEAWGEPPIREIP